jgi:hypothetical protein
MGKPTFNWLQLGFYYASMGKLQALWFNSMLLMKFGQHSSSFSAKEPLLPLKDPTYRRQAQLRG